jgi:hypothetical protein
MNKKVFFRKSQKNEVIEATVISLQITTEDVKGEPHPRHHGDLRVLVKTNLHIEVAKNIIIIDVIKNMEIVTQHTEMTARMTGDHHGVMTAGMIGEMTRADQTGGVTGGVVMTAIAVQADTIKTAVNYH